MCEFEASLVLYFTGVSRDSEKIIAEQSSSVSSGNSKSIEAMHGLKREAQEMKEYLLKGDFECVAETMRSGWLNKKNSSASVSNSMIDEIFMSALNAGASAGKVSGAGGGGFMMFFVPTQKRLDVIRNLQIFRGKILNCHFTEKGCEAWTI